LGAHSLQAPSATARILRGRQAPVRADGRPGGWHSGCTLRFHEEASLGTFLRLSIWRANYPYFHLGQPVVLTQQGLAANGP
jgi:hypothetical protein